MNPRGNGTVIFPDFDASSPSTPGSTPTKTTGLFRTRSSSLMLAQMKGQRPKRPTAVTIKHNVIVLNVHSNKRTRAHGFLMSIFSILDRWHLSVDLISSSEVHVSMAIHSESALLSGGGEDEYAILDQDLRGAVGELGMLGTIDIVPDMAIVSLVGKQLKNMVGISGKFFSVLGGNGINIEMISQGMYSCPFLSFSSLFLVLAKRLAKRCADEKFHRCQRDQHLVRHRGARGRPRPECCAHASFHISGVGVRLPYRALGLH